MNSNYGMMPNNNMNQNRDTLVKCLLIGSSIIFAILLSLGSFILLDSIKKSNNTSQKKEVVSTTNNNNYTPPVQEQKLPEVGETPTSIPESTPASKPDSTQAVTPDTTPAPTTTKSSSTYIEADSSYAFNLYGENYSLPVSVGALIDKGWNFYKSSDKDAVLSPEEKLYLDLTCPGDSKQHFQICAMNFSSGSASISQCHVVNITLFANSLAYLNTDATFYKGQFSVRKVTAQDLISVLGEPKYTNDTDYSTTYTFRFDDSLDCSIMISFKKKEAHPQWIRITHEVTP